MADAVPPAVEFVDGDPDPGPDETLAGPPAHDARHRLLVLLGAVLFVSACVLVARAGRAPDPGPASAASSAPGAPAPVRLPPVPADAVALPSGCVTAACAVVNGIPAPLQRAVHTVFPFAVLRDGYSVMSDDMRSLRSRNIQAQLGAQGLVVDVGAAPAVRHLSVHADRGRHLARAVVRVSHYRVTVTASDIRVPLACLVRLARDPAVIAPI